MASWMPLPCNKNSVRKTLLIALPLICFSSAEASEKALSAYTTPGFNKNEETSSSPKQQKPDNDARFYISRHPAKVVPRRVLPITPDMSGEVEVVYRGGSKALKDTLLLRINPDELALDEKELHLQIERNNLAAETEVLQLMRQKEELEFITKIPPERRVYVVQHLKANVDERALALLGRKIAATRENAKLNNERLQKAFEKKRKLREITMPFDGRIQYHLAIPEEGQRTLVSSNGPVVTIADDSMLYIVINMTDPALTRLDTSRLHISLKMGNGRTLTAPWSHSKVQKGDRGENMVYYFTVPEDERERVWPLVGANLVAHLYYQAEADSIYISKAELARQAGPSHFESWEELLAALLPGYTIVFNGETHLCLIRQEAK